MIVIAAASAAACQAETAAAPGVASAAAAPGIVAPVADDWAVAFVATPAGSYVSPSETDGTRSVTQGPYRLIVHRKTLEVAAEPFASPVVGAALFKGTWYFVTAEGSILRAPSFLGHPVDTGAVVGADASGVAVGRDLVIVTDWDEGLWSFDGNKATRLKLPGPVQVTGLASDSEGLPLVELCKGAGWYTVDAHGAFKPGSEPAEPMSRYRRDDLGMEGTEVLDKKLSEALAPRRATSSAALATLDDLVALPGGGFARGKQVFPKDGIDHCTTLQAGPETLAYCQSAYRSRQPNGVYRFRNGRFERWVDVPGRESPDAGPGPSLLMEQETGGMLRIHPGGRETFHPNELATAICDVPGAERASKVLGLVGSVVLMSRICGDQESFEVIDLSTRNDMRLATIDPIARFVPAGAVVLDAAMSADQSTLAILFRDAGNQVSVATGALGGKLQVHRLPPQVKGIAFADARRGLAIGTRLDQVWTTLDGGARWSRPTLPISGDPAAVPLDGPPFCTTFECSSGRTLTWADPRALKAVGYEQVSFVAPAHAHAGAAEGKLTPRRHLVSASELRRPRKRDERCPERPEREF